MNAGRGLRAARAVSRLTGGVACLVWLGGGACGGKAVAPVVPVATQRVAAKPAAVGKMFEGVQAAKEGQRDHAVTALRDALQIDPNLWEARFDLGIVLAGSGDLGGAESELTTAAKLAGDSEPVAVALGEVRRRRGENRDAADGLAEFVRAHPTAMEARTLYVASLRDSGQLDKAIAEAREVLLRKPGDATALAELSLAHLAKGEKEAAELLAKQALDANHNSAVSHRALGLLSLAKGDDAVAFAEFRKASQSDPHDTTSRLNMGTVLLKAGAYVKAEEQYREILKVSPDDRAAEVGLAAALRGAADAQHKDRIEEARTLLDRVLAGDAHDTSALFNMGVLYADFLKKPVEAAAYFQRFLSDAPSDHPLRAEANRYVSAASAEAPVTPATPSSGAAVTPSASPAGPPKKADH